MKRKQFKEFLKEYIQELSEDHFDKMEYVIARKDNMMYKD